MKNVYYLPVIDVQTGERKTLKLSEHTYRNLFRYAVFPCSGLEGVVERGDFGEPAL